MKTAAFSPSVKNAFSSHPNRRAAMVEIENSLQRLMKKYAGGWEAELDLGFEERIQQRERGVPHEKLVEFQVQWAADDLKQFVVVSAFRSVDLANGLVDAANGRSFLLCALTSRSLMELAAVLCWAHTEVKPYLENPLSAGDFDQAREILARISNVGRFDWKELVLGDPHELQRSGKWTRPSRQHLPKMRTLMQGLDLYAVQSGFSHKEGAVPLWYSILSDLVHPTVGSGFLYSGGERAGVFRLRQRRKEIAAWLLSYTVIPACNTLLVIERKLSEFSRIRIRVISKQEKI